MNSPFTTQGADRLLGLADQFLEDWEANEGKCDPECAERRADYNTIRPLFVAAPKMLEALQLIEVDKDGDGFICQEAMDQVRVAIDAATGETVSAPMPAQMVEPFTLVAEVHSTSDFGEAPSWAKIAVDQKFLDQLNRLRRLCVENNLESVSVYAVPEHWENQEDLRLRGDSLRVAGTSFWFEVHPKHADYNVETRSIEIDDLLKVIEMGRGDGIEHDEFRWSDGILFFGEVKNEGEGDRHE